MATHSSILPRESYGLGSLAGYSPYTHKEMEMTEAIWHACTPLREAALLLQWTDNWLEKQGEMGYMYLMDQQLV